MSLVKTSPSDELSELVENINAALNSIQKNSQHIMAWVHTIKTKELWRSTTAKTFSQFCEMQDWTPRRFEQLASGYAILLTIPEETRTMVRNERQVRELAKAPDKEREKVVKETKKRDGKVTAKGIEKTVEEQEYEPKEPEGISEPEPKIDGTGLIIPENVLTLWERGETEIKSLLSELAACKKVMTNARENNDPLYHGFNTQSWLLEFDRITYQLKSHIPFAVCPICSGQMSDKCLCCKGRGFVGKPYWNGPAILPEHKAMRTMVVKAQGEK